MSLGVAIIGSGLYVKQEHLPGVLKCSSFSLKAIYSRSLKSAQETAALLPSDHPQPDLYHESSDTNNGYDQLLARQDVSCIIIALPIVAQPEFVKRALDAGKHVLSEKPIAKDLETAAALIAYAKTTSGTFAVAENMRFYKSFTWAREQAESLGKVTNFGVRVLSFMSDDSKWYQTGWRQKPEYQGGFLLDGGVHFAAATRLLLGNSKVATVQAYSALIHKHLPPIDGVSAVIKTVNGGVGTYQHSVGSKLSAFEWDVAYELGSIRVVGEQVQVVTANGEAITRDFPRTSGVPEELAAWAQGILDGKPNALQSPEEALADLEFLELMFLSGEEAGGEKKYELQL